MTDERFAYDRFLIKQRIRPMVNLYEVFALPAGSDQPGEEVAFVRQKRMALKEDLRAFADDSEQEEVFRIKARSVIDVGARYNVVAPDGSPIGALQKEFRKSLVRSSWRVLGADDAELFRATERSLPIAIARRTVGLLPFEFPIPIPYHFHLLRDGEEIGGLVRVIALRDQYRLELPGDPERTIDRRLAIALAIGLDAFQAR